MSREFNSKVKLPKNNPISRVSKELFSSGKTYLFKQFFTTPKALNFTKTYMQRSKMLNINHKVFNNNNIRTPHLLFFGFFATNEANGTKKIQLFQKHLGDIYSAAIQTGIIKLNQTLVIEIFHHLGTKPITDEMKKAKAISGFDLRYFKVFRPQELKVILLDQYRFSI